MPGIERSIEMDASVTGLPLLEMVVLKNKLCMAFSGLGVISKDTVSPFTVLMQGPAFIMQPGSLYCNSDALTL